MKNEILENRLIHSFLASVCDNIPLDRPPEPRDDSRHVPESGKNGISKTTLKPPPYQGESDLDLERSL